MAHDNDYGWWEIEEKLQMARAKGLNMWGEYFPYDAGSTPVSADFLQPELCEKTYGYEYEETLYDPLADKFLDKAAYEALKKKDPGQSIIVFMPARKKWMPYWLTIPHMTVASDAMAGIGTDGKLLPWDADYSKYAGHPRTAGCYARTLRMGREQGAPLMFTLAQLHYWSALHLGDAGLEAMKERGRVQVGKVADLTLFDPKTLMRGVTTVRDPGGDSLRLKRAIDERLVPGPRIVTAGPNVGPTNGHGDNRLPYTGHPRFDWAGMTPDRRVNVSNMEDGPAEVLAASREVLRQGASFIKIMAGGGVGGELDPLDSKQMTPEEMRAAVQAAADWNTYVGAHAYNSESVRRAIDAGVKVIEHGQMIDEETMQYAVDRGIWFPSQYIVFTIDIPTFSEASREKQQFVLSHTERFFEIAKKYNAKLTFGTNLVVSADASLQTKELVARSRWFSPFEILVQATSRARELIVLSGPRNPYPGKLGVIEEGAYADLILVNGNPLENIDFVGDPGQNFVVIMKDGVIFRNTIR